MIKRSIVALSMFAALSPMSASTFDYYTDGIYDAYMQINRDIRSGLSRKYLPYLSGKFLVAMSVDKSSTVDIIFYKTVGSKNNLTPIIAEYTPTGKNYIIFGYYDRKADAKYLRKKIKSYGIPARIFVGEGAKTWRRNPVVIRKIIQDLKISLRNTPVQVAVIEKSYKKLPPLPHPGQVRKADKGRNRNMALEEFLVLKRQRNKMSSDGNTLRLGNGKKVSRGKRATPHLTLQGILCDHDTCTVLFRGDDRKRYRFIVSKTSGMSGKSSPPKSAVPVKAKGSQKEGSATPTDKGKDGNLDLKKVKCDFSKIETAKDAEGKPVRVRDTAYSGLRAKVSILGEEGHHIKVRVPGGDPLLISRRAFLRACEKE